MKIIIKQEFQSKRNVWNTSSKALSRVSNVNKGVRSVINIPDDQKHLEWLHLSQANSTMKLDHLLMLEKIRMNRVFVNSRVPFLLCEDLFSLP